MTDTSTTAAGGRRPMLLAAALAAVALLAGGIALVATGGDDDPPRLDLGAGAAAPAVADGGDSARVAESAELAADDMAGTSMMAWVRYVAGDELADLGGSAPVHRLVADDDDLRRLADHFGVEGEITDGEGDGMQRTITEGATTVGRYGASFWYTSGQEYPGSSDRAVASECAPDAVCEEPAPMPPPERPADMPSQSEAEEIVRGIAEAAGLDLTGARITSYDNVTTWGVNIELALDGAVIPGWSVYGTVMAGGEVLDAGGALGSLEEVGDYPLDTTRAAIDRLNEQMGGGPGSEQPAIEPAPADSGAETAVEPDVQTDPATQVAPAPQSDPASGGGVEGSAGSDAGTSDIAEPAPDEMTIMPVEGDGEPMTVTLRTAELSYAMVGNADGTETYLVPAYLLDGENDRGEEWLDVFAIAVQAEFLGA